MYVKVYIAAHPTAARTHRSQQLADTDRGSRSDPLSAESIATVGRVEARAIKWLQLSGSDPVQFHRRVPEPAAAAADLAGAAGSRHRDRN